MKRIFKKHMALGIIFSIVCQLLVFTTNVWAAEEGCWPLTTSHNVTNTYSKTKPHYGYDFGTATTGTKVYSSFSGTVYKSEDIKDSNGNYTSYGRLVVVKSSVNGKTIYSLYAHLSKRSVAKGDKVSAGQIIGEVGSTGNSTGPHLHFEIREGTYTGYPGNTRNPGEYISQKKNPLSTKPAAPKISSVSATGDNQIEIKWGSVSGATEYVLQGRKSGGEYADIKTLTGTSYTHSNLDGSSLYWYRVKAKNSAGSSEYSTANAAYTKPSQPSAGTVNTNSINVSWSSSGGSSNYELLARKCGDAEYSTIATVNGYSYTHTGLQAGTQYYYKIKAHNTEHTSIISGRSDSGTSFTRANAPVVTAKTANSVSLSFNRGPMDGAYTYTYRICRRVSGTQNYAAIAVTANNNYTDYGVAPNTKYDYYFDILRNGQYIVNSEGTTITTNEQLPESVSVSNSSLTLTEGQSYNLYATISPNNANNKSVTWSSSNNNVVSVSNGTITAISAGTANITARTVNGKTAICVVTVQSKVCTHSYGEWNVINAATCTESGSKERTCQLCGAVETEIIPTAGHDFSSEWTVTKEATCTQTGEKKHLCTVCSFADETTVEVIDATGHTGNGIWIVDEEPSCLDVGIKHQNCTLCDKNCDITEIPTIPHTFSNEWIVEQEATCQQGGIEYHICECCNEREYRYTDIVEHNYDVTDFKDATTTEDGYIVYKCIHCDDTYTDITPIIVQKTELLLSNVVAKVGETIDIMLSVNNNSGFSSAKLKIEYDDSVFTLINVADAGILGSTSHSPTFTSPYTLYWNNGSATENYTVNGVIATLTFKVKDNATKGLYPIRIDFTDDDVLDVDMNSVNISSTEGIIEIIDSMLGDINSDNKVNVKDNMILSRYIAEWPDYTQEKYNISAADLNLDGKVNVKDDMILARFIAEWPDYETLPYIK